MNYDNEEKSIQALTVLTKFLHKRRLITFGGNFAEARKLLNLDDIDTGDLVNLEDEQKKIFKKSRKCYLNSGLKLVAIFAKNKGVDCFET